MLALPCHRWSWDNGIETDDEQLGTLAECPVGWLALNTQAHMHTHVLFEPQLFVTT
jgi:hypothetical protein